MSTQKEQLGKLIDRVLTQKSRDRGSKELLENLVEAVNDQPLLLWDSKKLSQLSSVALRVLLLDIITDEEEEIAWVHKTYAYITQALLNARANGADKASLFDILKNRVILLHSHDDFFMETLDYFFFHNTPITEETERAERRSFVLKKIAAMQVKDLQTLEAYDKELNKDEYLLAVEQTLLDKYQFSENELVEAQLLLDTLYKYIWHQITN